MDRYSGLGRSRRYRRKPVRRVLAEIGLIAAAISFGGLLVFLAVLGYLDSAR